MKSISMALVFGALIKNVLTEKAARADVFTLEKKKAAGFIAAFISTLCKYQSNYGAGETY